MKRWSSRLDVTSLYSVCHQGSGGQHLIRSHVIQEGLEGAISIWAQVRDLTAEEDAALLEALDLEGSPLAGGGIRMAGSTGGGLAPSGCLGQRNRLRAFS
jgi:hypothetical protein